jgi:leucyl aminopeptidase
VEILNTDAEGRLILVDAVRYAHRLGATHIVDAATLTGACITALGNHVSGLFGAPDGFRDFVKASADAAGECVWPMPTFAEYREQLKSDVADLANVGGRSGGACTAASFIRAFVDPGVQWAHLDIAGTAFATSDRPYQERGPTAAGLRVFVEVATRLSSA